MPLEQRFWRHVDRRGANDCWEWKASRNQDGYGRFLLDTSRVTPKSVNSHRVAYVLAVGPIPTGLTLDHLCRNRGCVNPAHLEPVTLGENVLRGNGIPARRARQTHCLRGHLLAGDNLYPSPRGHRQCRACRRVRPVPPTDVSIVLSS